jgi:hypothetical protein
VPTRGSSAQVADEVFAPDSFSLLVLKTENGLGDNPQPAVAEPDTLSLAILTTASTDK